MKKAKAEINNDIIFIKQVPIYPRDSLNRLRLDRLRKTDEIKFTK